MKDAVTTRSQTIQGFPYSNFLAIRSVVQASPISIHGGSSDVHFSTEVSDDRYPPDARTGDASAGYVQSGDNCDQSGDNFEEAVPGAVDLEHDHRAGRNGTTEHVGDVCGNSQSVPRCSVCLGSFDENRQGDHKQRRWTPCLTEFLTVGPGFGLSTLSTRVPLTRLRGSRYECGTLFIPTQLIELYTHDVRGQCGHRGEGFLASDALVMQMTSILAMRDVSPSS